MNRIRIKEVFGLAESTQHDWKKQGNKRRKLILFLESLSYDKTVKKMKEINEMMEEEQNGKI